jgi:hypothetical protein
MRLVIPIDKGMMANVGSAGFTTVLADCRGVVLAMHLLIGLGDTVVYKLGGWSGTSENLHPNEPLHWTGIDWARGRGYRYYDFDDISLPVARAVLAREEMPPTASTGRPSAEAPCMR